MKQQMTAGLDLKLQEMAQRIRDLREIVGLSEEEMARQTGITLAEYRQCEAGETDLNFAFIYRCAQAFGVDVTDIIEGSSPRLSNYTLTRAGEGQHIEHAHGMTYYNMAARFKKRVAEPLYVVAEYSDEAQLRPIDCTTHEGQECDIVLSGQLKVQVGEHIEILNPGDIIYYNSTASHGMIATGGQDCVFYAIVLEGGEEAAPLPAPEPVPAEKPQLPKPPQEEPRIWEKFIEVDEAPDGSLKNIRFKDPDHFNFAFDVVDGLARRKPDKLAMVHVDRYKEERYFTFLDMALQPGRQLLPVPGHQAGRPGTADPEAALPVLVRHPGPAQDRRRGPAGLQPDDDPRSGVPLPGRRHLRRGLHRQRRGQPPRRGGCGKLPRHDQDHGGRLPGGMARL